MVPQRSTEPLVRARLQQLSFFLA
uniref:Uncharacterized protein n=1 Tax=Anguilla anguilla TaxID=7936 RepID=A0A0E9UUX6_ANGAN